MMIKAFAQFKALFLALALVLLTAPALYAAVIPAPPQLAARSYLVMDAATGNVLVARNEHERYPPASLVKIMTSYIAEQEIIAGNLAETDMVHISERAWRTGGSRMFVQEGTQVSVIDLLRGIIIQSGNDASVAIAEHIAGSEEAFAEMMNVYAQRLGMHNTRFENATGLPADNQYASAYDLALLAQALIQNSPDYYPIYAEKYFEYNGIRQPNRNRLLWRDASVDGIKTGHTSEAGYCLVSSAVRDDMRLISVVMGSASEETRAQETQQLLAYAYRFFNTHQLYGARELIAQPRVWGGAVDQLGLGVETPLAVTVARGQEDRLQVDLQLPKSIKAPISAGQVLGSVSVSLDGEVLAERPLLALEHVEQGSLLKRLWHLILQFFTGLFG